MDARTKKTVIRIAFLAIAAIFLLFGIFFEGVRNGRWQMTAFFAVAAAMNVFLLFRLK